MGIGPILSWGKENKLEMIKKILPSFLITMLLTILFFSIYRLITPMGVAGIFLAFWIISNNLFMLYKKKKVSMKQKKSAV